MKKTTKTQKRTIRWDRIALVIALVLTASRLMALLFGAIFTFSIPTYDPNFRQNSTEFEKYAYHSTRMIPHGKKEKYFADIEEKNKNEEKIVEQESTLVNEVNIVEENSTLQNEVSVVEEKANLGNFQKTKGRRARTVEEKPSITKKKAERMPRTIHFSKDTTLTTSSSVNDLEKADSSDHLINDIIVEEESVENQLEPIAYESEASLLAKIIFAEAGGCSTAEMARVGQVVLNRINTDYYEFKECTNVYTTLTQKGQYPDTLQKIRNGLEASEDAKIIAEGLLKGTVLSGISEDVYWQTGFIPDWNVKVVYTSKWHYYSTLAG